MTKNNEQLLSFVSQQGLDKDSHNQALSMVLDKVLDIFNCDRAWCLFPCDPEADYWGVPIESTRYSWPGVKNVELDMPTVESDIETFNLHLNANRPITLGINCDFPVPEYLTKVFSVKSQIASVIYPKQGKPWMFGLHFCEDHHDFIDSEIELFDLLGKELAKTFDNLIFK